MRALTLTQPWAGLVASGIKLIENRDRPVIRNADIVSGPVAVAIHASREIDESVYPRIDQLWPRCGMYVGDNDATCPELLCRRREGHGGACDNVAGEDDDQEWMRLSRITSAVIAVATVRDVVYIGGCSREHIATICAGRGIPEQARWMFGPTSYVLHNVRSLPSPVSSRGWQGFWHLTPKDERERGEQSVIERAVLEQLSAIGHGK